ncbi:YhdP family protein [Shewanella youngdeokensis]|uniref:YhdP family protein n=1 Tax=Shewanella youngdeokensis TaxID=2999068 RepID=A0ABZ0JY51_9GAMM|nr:YhdP family protein [Shewanella sp. DAU334]
MSPKSRQYSLTRFCLQSLAIVLVLFALAVSLFRGLLPQLDQVRLELIDFVYDNYQVEVEVGQLQAEWQAFGPALTVNKFVLPVQNKLPVALILEQVQVKFDFWQSLLTLSPQIENVIFDDVNIAFDLDRLSSTSVKSNQAVETDWLYQLLLEQLAHFSITDARVQLLSQHHEYRPIFIKDMKWHNDSKRHRGQGKLFLDEEASEIEHLTLSVDLKGDGHKPETLMGQLYLAAGSLDIGEWASRQPNPFNPNKKLLLEGVVNLEAWIGFANREFIDATVAFQPSWLEWHLNDEPQKFEVQAGAMRWHPSPNGWLLSSHGLRFATNGELWPSPELSAQRQGDRIDAYLNQLDLTTVMPLLPLVPGIDLATLGTWQSLAPTGSVDNSHFQWQINEQKPVMSLNLNQVSWQAHAAIPGLSAIDAKIKVTDSALNFALPTQQYVIDFNGGFEAPLQFKGEAFTGQFDFAASTLSLPQLSFSNADISLAAATKLEFSDATHMALLADVDIHDVAHAHRYFPLNGMSNTLVDYLSGALKAGHTDDAVVLWHGTFQDYPYVEHAGVFQAGFTLEQAIFEFQDTWPAVSELTLSALFQNKSMDLWIDKGQLLDMPADGAYIGIPTMGPQTVLLVKADLATKAEAVNAVIEHSPLADSVGATLDVVQVSGDITGQIDLNIPLYAGPESVIKGNVNFDQTPMYISKPGVKLENVTGVIEFENSVVTGNDLHALMFSQPLMLSFDTGKVNNNYAVNVDFDGQWQLDTVPSALDNPLSQYVDGGVDWSGGLMLIFDPSGFRIQAQVESDLLGTALSLPAPFSKAADQKALFTAELIGDNKQASLGIKLNDQLEFWGGFDALSAGSLTHFDLLLGRLFKPGDQLRKQQGHLKIDLDHTEFSPWLPIIKGFTAAISSSDSATSEAKSPAFFPPLTSISADFNELDLSGQKINDLHFEAGPTEHAWRFEATSQQFDGRIDFYPDWITQGLKVVASKLYLSPEAQAGTGVTAAPESVISKLPPLAVDVDDFKIYDRSMGHLVLQATPEDERYNIQTLSMTTPEVKLSGTGSWSVVEGDSLTAFDLSIDASKFHHLSAQLGFDPGLKNAPTAVKGQLSWVGAPYAFSLDTLNGEVVFELDKGHLSQVSDKGARIFSLFSLDSLLRKLSLDFTDVFGRGLYFDTFNGTLMIDNGVVKTTDTEMKAVVGDMRVRGYTDLMSESLNYDISFVPQLASSVPTVVFLSTGGWTLGLGAFALTKVLEPVIEVISELRFRVTGTMSEPKLEELERRSKEIKIPESILPKKVDPAAPAVNSTGKQNKISLPNVNVDSTADTEAEVKTNVINKHDSAQVLEPTEGVINKAVAPANSADAINTMGSDAVTPALKLIQGELDASQPIAMSKQLQRHREPRLYRVAA